MVENRCLDDPFMQIDPSEKKKKGRKMIFLLKSLLKKCKRWTNPFLVGILYDNMKKNQCLSGLKTSQIFFWLGIIPPGGAQNKLPMYFVKAP